MPGIDEEITYRGSSKSSRSRWSGLSTLSLRKRRSKKSQARILRFSFNSAKKLQVSYSAPDRQTDRYLQGLHGLQQIQQVQQDQALPYRQWLQQVQEVQLVQSNHGDHPYQELHQHPWLLGHP